MNIYALIKPFDFYFSFNICGRVIIDKFPESLSQQVTKRKMIIFPEGKGSAAVSKETNDDGKFCTAVTPGKYIVRVSHKCLLVGYFVFPSIYSSSYLGQGNF